DSSPVSLQMTAPSDGATVSGTAFCTSSTPVGNTGVQFLLDGQPLGPFIPSPPYVFSWDTTTAVNGTRWLASQSANALGIGGTSDVVRVTVQNDVSIPRVTLTDPVSGATVSGNTVVAATASDDQSIPVVRFYLDGTQLGAAASTPPFNAI